MTSGAASASTSSSTPTSSASLISGRHHYTGANLGISYVEDGGIHMVKGEKQYMYDNQGKKYLDATNNVAHVGHCHPHVIEAAYQQMKQLNTNTRYLDSQLIEYARLLTSTFPSELHTCYFVNSGSEANDLAYRMACTITRAWDIICIDAAYHGNTYAMIQASPYKFESKGGQGQAAHVHKVMIPDVYRGQYKFDEVDAGEKYARDVKEKIQNATSQGRKIAAFFCESVLGCAGQVVLPPGYLHHAYQHVRAVGGVCVADEVQVGLGRVGTHWWGFQTQDVIPDIVTLGKPAGNGFPVAAVVCRSSIAAAFSNGMEYFNTFGGSNLSCAVGRAVIEVIQREKLMENARIVGSYLMYRLTQLKFKYPIIGDVRGLGLFVGIEFVLCPRQLTPAAAEATHVALAMKRAGILLSTDGPYHNVIKIKPPLCFSRENADELVNAMDHILKEMSIKPVWKQHEDVKLITPTSRL